MSNIVVPELGESVVEARVARWLKKEGDRVEVGEPLVELETEKIDLEVSADKRGVLASIKRKEGEDVKIGELLAVVDENGAGAAAARHRQRNATAGSRRAGRSAAPTQRPQASQPTTDSAVAPTSDTRRTDQRSQGRTDHATKQESHRQRDKLAPTREATIAPTRRQASHQHQSAIAPKSACA